MDQAFAAWRQDLAAGHSSLLIAATGRDVKALNVRAHAARVDGGEVSIDDVALHDGTSAAIGDLVVTPDATTSDSGPTTAATSSRNGDTWTVTQRHRDGCLSLRGGEGAEVRVPADYVAAHLELGYATTAARAQGRTVDAAHAIIDQVYTRETFCVTATRARQPTHLYADTGAEMTVDPEPAV